MNSTDFSYRRAIFCLHWVHSGRIFYVNLARIFNLCETSPPQPHPLLLLNQTCPVPSVVQMWYCDLPSQKSTLTSKKSPWTLTACLLLKHGELILTSLWQNISVDAEQTAQWLFWTDSTCFTKTAIFGTNKAVKRCSCWSKPVNIFIKSYSAKNCHSLFMSCCAAEF